MTGSRLNTWMPLYWADYRADTSHLSAIEHGGYFLLIGHYWITGKPLPADDAQLARIAAMTTAEWRKHRGVILEFFNLAEGIWHHGRIDHELAHAKAVSDARKEAGKRGGRPKQTDNQNESKPEPIAKPIANQTGKQNETQLQPPSQEERDTKPKQESDLKKSLSEVPRKSAAGSHGPDYSDPENRKQRWLQRIMPDLVRKQGPAQAMLTIEAYERGDPNAKRTLDLLSQGLGKEPKKAQA
jgi:uncharacterized protein YdaU (DUF1376 family)